MEPERKRGRGGARAGAGRRAGGRNRSIGERLADELHAIDRAIRRLGGKVMLLKRIGDSDPTKLLDYHAKLLSLAVARERLVGEVVEDTKQITFGFEHEALPAPVLREIEAHVEREE
jgi:hypothetical protein